MFKSFLFVLFFIINVNALEPISPIPLSNDVDMKKVKLGKMLFSDMILSRDNSTACLSCHNIYAGGADTKRVSSGFEGKEGNIQSPTVFNAKYNFRQFWNGRAKDLLEQADGPMRNPVEHNMDSNTIEQRLNASKRYVEAFKEAYGVSKITYGLVLDAIVQFENALTTPNSKFDRYLRNEIKLSQDEEDGYKYFKQYGCITCHNGINIGGNSFQKMGTFIEYRSPFKFPDRSEITNKKMHHNVFKVPTLRNINLTPPYFHDGSAKTLSQAVAVMSRHNLGTTFSKDQIEKIVLFLKTLDGEKPKILDTDE